MFILDAYTEISGGRTQTTESTKEVEVMLNFKSQLAPIKVAVLPLSKKDELAKPAQEIFTTLSAQWHCLYDETGSIGRRYRRQDEVGTPFCVTVDFETLQDKAVTVRDRNTMAQERIAIDQLTAHLTSRLS